MRNNLKTQFIAAVVIAACARCHADDTQHERLAKAVAPYVDAQTLVVAHIDLGSVDATRSVDLLAQLFRFGEQETARVKGLLAPLEVLHGTLPEGTTADVFVVASLSDMKIAEINAAGINLSRYSSLPFFVVVSQEGNSPARAIAIEIRRALAARWNAEVALEQVGNAIITASPRTIERLKKAQPTPRPEIAAGLQAAGSGAAHFLFVPSIDARRAIGLLLPAAKTEKDADATRGLMQDVVWVAVGLDLPPEPSALRVAIRSPSDEAARSLEQRLSGSTKALVQRSDIRDNPKLVELAERLIPKASGDRLRMEVTEMTASLDDLSAILNALLKAARSEPAR